MLKLLSLVNYLIFVIDPIPCFKLKYRSFSFYLILLRFWSVFNMNLCEHFFLFLLFLVSPTKYAFIFLYYVIICCFLGILLFFLWLSLILYFKILCWVLKNLNPLICNLFHLRFVNVLCISLFFVTWTFLIIEAFIYRKR